MTSPDEQRERQFEYLLNAFEQASQSVAPALVGYAAKRKALFAYVADLQARARLPLGPPPGWLPIESAPPPYEPLLAWTKEGVEIAFYQRENGGSDGKIAGRWYGGPDGSIEMRVTHWMPLPPPVLPPEGKPNDF